MRKVLFFVGLILVLGFMGCSGGEITGDDVQVARKIFNGLCKGEKNVERYIDWENLKAVGVDVGKTYSSILSEKERSDYRNAFLYNFAYAFRASGGRIENFFNWRIHERQPDKNKTIVAADVRSGRVILFTLISKNGKRNLAEINWQ